MSGKIGFVEKAGVEVSDWEEDTWIKYALFKFVEGE